jgi:hypothetical protein
MSLPARRIDNKCPGKVIGFFQSYKMGASFKFESIPEQHFFSLLDTDARVERFYPQPRKFWYVEDGRKRPYTPDVCVHYVGTVRPCYIEVKPAGVAQYWEETGKTERLRSVINAHDADFEVVTTIYIEAEPRLSNTLLIRRYRSFPVRASCERQISAALAVGPQTIHSLALLYPHIEDLVCVVYALIHRGSIAIDLSLAITRASTISTVRG